MKRVLMSQFVACSRQIGILLMQKLRRTWDDIRDNFVIIIIIINIFNLA